MPPLRHLHAVEISGSPKRPVVSAEPMPPVFRHLSEGWQHGIATRQWIDQWVCGQVEVNPVTGAGINSRAPRKSFPCFGAALQKQRRTGAGGFVWSRENSFPVSWNLFAGATRS